ALPSIEDQPRGDRITRAARKFPCPRHLVPQEGSSNRLVEALGIDEKVVDLSLVLPIRSAKDTPTSLNELPSSRRRGEDQRMIDPGDVDSLVEAANREHDAAAALELCERLLLGTGDLSMIFHAPQSSGLDCRASL